MGLVRLPDDRLVVLLAEHVFGRSRRCDTVVEDPDTSSRHALFFWHDEQWWVRDLGSTNGTFVNGEAIAGGKAIALSVKDVVKLANHSLSLQETSAPNPAVLCLDTGELQTGEPSLILIPNADEPTASAYLAKGSQWWLDIEGQSSELVDGQIFRHNERNYRFFSGGKFAPTAQHATSTLRLSELELEFRVSLDEEHVELAGQGGGRRFDLGSRACNYVLLTLARQRQHDGADASLPETSHGWVDSLDLLKMLGCNETKLSVDICRIRQVFSKAGFDDASDIIERRRGTRQLRLGLANVTIVQV